MPYKDPEKARQNRVAHRAANRDQILARDRAYSQTPTRKARVKIISKEWLSDPRNRMRVLTSAAYHRALDKGLVFDPALGAHLMASPATHCNCCGRELNYVGRRGDRFDDSPSLDRSNPNEGYTIANVRVLCWRCNALKKNATIQELETVVAYMLGRGPD